MAETVQGIAQSPPLAILATALRATSERLAEELAHPQPRAPEWSAPEWRVARAVAAMQGISGLLAERLLWRGPPGWPDFLARQREHIAQRHLRSQALLAAVGERFTQRAIPVQPLKGAALYEEGLYRPGQRPMADLDLLVSSRHGAAAGELLEELGLRESHRTFKHRIFEEPHDSTCARFGEHAGNAMKVELHERICERLPHRLTDISSLLTAIEPRPGLNPYPSRAALMGHLLLHAAGGMASRTLRLVQLHDIALLAPRLTADDWQRLLGWRPWWAAPPLMLMESYYGRTLEPTRMARLRSFCPPLLRHTCTRQRLTDVSLSRLWLEAFPGIEWARTGGEAVRFAIRRVIPSAEVRSDRHFALATDPSLSQGDWGRLSQGRRLLRALRAHTPRPWPLHNVREALTAPE